MKNTKLQFIKKTGTSLLLIVFLFGVAFKANAQTNVNPADTWQQAQTVSTFPFSATLNATSIPLNNDYNLPPTNITDGPDVVYKLVFNEDTYLNASVTSGNNGKVALYPQGFNGADGPGVDNNYTGPALTGISDWLHYDDDVCANSWNFEDWAIMFTPSQLSAYANCQLSKVGLFDILGNTGNITIKIYEGGTSSPTQGSLKRTLTYQTQGNGAYHYVNLTSPLNIDTTKNLWITLHCDNTSSGHAACSATNTDRNGRWIKSGNNWVEMTWQANLAWKIRALVTNQSGRSLPLGGNRDAGEIENLTVTPGTYYLVASSTSNVFSLSINTATLPCPEPASQPSPANDSTEVDPSSVELTWHLGERTTEYRLMFGTSPSCNTVLINWTDRLIEHQSVAELNNNTQYYWRIDERNDACPAGTTGPVWSFTTHLNVPQLSIANNKIYVGDDAVLTWTNPASSSLQSYNIYQDNVLIGNTTQNTYTVSGLAYKPSGYRFNVTAVYNAGESGFSNNSMVYVSGQGSVEGYVYEQDGTTPIANATVSISGHDEFNRSRSYSFDADANGHYSGTVYAGAYSANADASGYQTTAYQNSAHTNAFNVAYNQTTTGINFNMDELFIPVNSVAVAYFPVATDPNCPYAKITWVNNRSLNGDRSFLCYRVYRTEAYNFGPYTSSNTTLLADNLTGTTYTDLTWGDLSMGSYKYGVSCVYAGNREGGSRESEIVWSNFLDMDMYLGANAVNITVTLSCGDTPEGAVVNFVNLDENEQTYHPVPDVVLGSTGYYAWNRFRKGNYQVTVSMNGFETLTDTVDLTAPASLSYQLTEILLEASGLYVSSTGWAKWKGNDNRHFNHYEVVLTNTTGNNVLYSGTTANNHIQLPVEGLTAGQTYRCKVRNVYTAATSAWTSVDWVYQSGSGFDAATSFTAEALTTGNQLTWTYPDAGAKAGRGVYTDRGTHAYGICVWGQDDVLEEIWTRGLIKFSLSSPATFTNLNNTDPSIFTNNSYGLDYCPVDGYYYTYNNYKLYRIDLNAHEIVSETDIAIQLRDGAWDVTTNTMYGIWGKKLYRLNLNTGDYTLVATMSKEMVALACDNDGQLYGVEFKSSNKSNLYKINKSNGAVTSVGQLPRNAYYSQSASFDRETGTLYWSHSNLDGDNFYSITINSNNTIQTNLVCANTGQIEGMYIPTHSTQVIGALVFRDGEAIAFTSESSYLDAGISGSHEYGVRIVYGGASICPDYNAFYSMSAPLTDSIVSASIAQTAPLVNGWNWWSTYIEQSDINGLEMLQNSLGAACVRIQGRNAYLDRLAFGDFVYWDGNLTALANEEFYMIRTNAACSAVIFGQEAIPENHPITVNPGWNWIGFPSAQSLSLATALSGISIEANDQIKGRNQYATYLGNFGGIDYWDGTLTTFNPGEGYMYKSNATTAKTLVYQTGRDSELVPNITTEDNIYTPASENYADNMTVTAVIELDGEELRSDAYELAAFVGDECRGSVKLKYVEPIDRYVAFLLVYGDVEEEMSFVLTDGDEALWANENIVFTANGIVGKGTEPYVLRFGSTSVAEQLGSSLRVYPNPVACGERFSISAEEAGAVRVEIINALSAVISAESVSTMPATLVAPSVPGVYTLRLTTGNGVRAQKLVVE